MLKGYTLPRTPNGTSSLAPAPPWHYAGSCLAVEYEAAEGAATQLLPPGLEYWGPRCAAYFIEWQFCSDDGGELLDPERSQYKESLFLVSAKYRGEFCSFCPFIWVDQDTSLMRGLAQGWPKQIGETWITRSYGLQSKASPFAGAGGCFGAALSAKGRRLAEASVTLSEKCGELPSPNFAKAVNVRYFPDLVSGRHDKPLINQLAALKSRDIKVSEIWKGEAELKIFDHPYQELPLLRPEKVLAGYRFEFALTVDDLALL